jgi:hypothetical protein
MGVEYEPPILHPWLGWWAWLGSLQEVCHHTDTRKVCKWVFSVLQQASKHKRKRENKAWGFSSTQVQPFVCLLQHGR